MRAPNNLRRGEVGFNMTPMIDVVFLLIIFFLVSSHLAQQEVQLDLDLPEASSGQRSTDDSIRRVVVNVLPGEEAGRRIMVGGQLLDKDELAQLIAYESQNTDRQIEIRIRSHRKVPYRFVEPIMLACAESGVWKVTFAVVEK